MIPQLIKYFNCVAVKPGEHLFKPEMVNQLAARCGYLVHPQACTQDVVKFLQEEVSNYNSTFYKSWSQVDSLEEAEMRVLQLLHYLSTYGTDYMGRTFTMNDFPEEMRFTEFKILMPCTERDLFDRIMGILTSGIALHAETLDLIVKQALIYSKENGWEINPEAIQNREARAVYYISKGELPHDPFELMRILMYTAKENATIINDEYTWIRIANSISQIVELISKLDELHLILLSKVFYRYRRIFLFIRHEAKKLMHINSDECVSRINALRRMARKNHVPMKPGVLQTILSAEHTAEEAEAAINDTSSCFVLIRLLNYLNACQQRPIVRTFNIRNGSIWIEPESAKHPAYAPEKIETVRQAVLRRLKKLLEPKARKADGAPVTVKYPERLELAAPVSEKMFVGALPYGSRFALSANSYIGVYWRNEWGTRDYDLWVIDIHGNNMGWAGMHKNSNILFSGDMTDADPEATEIMYCRGTWPDSTVRVCRYNGEAGSKFRIFFGTDNIEELPLNYMVNPDTIQLAEDMTSDKSEVTVAVVADSMAYFTSMKLSQSLLPQLMDNKCSTEKALAEYMRSFTSLRDVLGAAGFAECPTDGTPDIDLTKDLSKDTLISLFN